MGFGGGGGGGAITNHVHSNAVGEGGSLSDSLSLINNENLANRITMEAIIFG